MEKLTIKFYLNRFEYIPKIINHVRGKLGISKKTVFYLEKVPFCIKDDGIYLNNKIVFKKLAPQRMIINIVYDIPRYRAITTYEQCGSIPIGILDELISFFSKKISGDPCIITVDNDEFIYYCIYNDFQEIRLATKKYLVNIAAIYYYEYKEKSVL